jgi:SAM-dependent methyltransferase
MLRKIFMEGMGDEIALALNRINSQGLDIKRLLSHDINKNDYQLKTDFPFAFRSSDFKSPKGAVMDFTRRPSYVMDCMNLFESPISYLDIGCSNGGLVYDFLLAGNDAIGIEGSDYGKKNGSEHWGVIPSRLFTADATKVFSINNGADAAQFDVIGAWEVLEHIEVSDFEIFFSNIRRHLKLSGVFMASVAQFPDFDPITGDVWHVTLEAKSWWVDQFERHGLREIEIPKGFRFPRGDGNPTVYDWDAKVDPSKGFHVFLKKIT